jgi:hypothetical protein
VAFKGFQNVVKSENRSTKQRSAFVVQVHEFLSFLCFSPNVSGKCRNSDMKYVIVSSIRISFDESFAFNVLFLL